MHPYPLVSMVRVNQARQRFFDQGDVPRGLIPEVILRSWHRSQRNGIRANQEPADQPILSADRLADARLAGEDLLQYSRPVMEHLYNQIRDTSSMVILTDATGTILHSLGDSNFVGRARKVSLQPGGVWSEPARGTNAIGTALIEQEPVVIHRSEHFTAANQFLTCSASPIIDPFGRIKGILDVSSDSRAFQQHTMALVRISTQQIENQMFSKGFEDGLTLQFHRHPQFIGTFYEGIAVFNREGQLTAANRSALLQLGIDRYQVEPTSFSRLFDLPFDQLCRQASAAVKPVLELHGQQGKAFFARVRPWKDAGHSSRTIAAKPVHASKQRPPADTPPRRLEELELGDPAMQHTIARARKVLRHDIPIIIEGESGTGKELLARALHHGSPRRNGPFVALNCAAIPAGLIETELFGYQDGAFTGARRKGHLGKLRQAHGGTLFLDEIGDMPLELQARLLRVLQERTVAPLGGTEEHPVEIGVICATNRRIRDDVAAGRFREDLYYRLNGLLLTLPPLREREDRLALADGLLAEFAPPGRPLRIGKPVAELFSRHPWPGNIRQLYNLLRTAAALLDGEQELMLEHLPEDFLAQLGEDLRLPADQRAPSDLLTDQTRLDDLERLAIDRTLQDCNGNLSAAARRLGISRTTLYRKLRRNS